MECLKLLLLVVLLSNACLGHEYHSMWSHDVQNDIVGAHNVLRLKQKGCGMIRMEYNLTLESNARRWSNKCIFKHQENTVFGENIAKGGCNDNSTNIMNNALNMWASEAEHFDYNDTSPEAYEYVGHVMQMVWAKTYKVGCYVTFCPDFCFTICLYDPPGNYANTPAYTKECSKKCQKVLATKDDPCPLNEGSNPKTSKASSSDNSPSTTTTTSSTTTTTPSETTTTPSETTTTPSETTTTPSETTTTSSTTTTTPSETTTTPSTTTTTPSETTTISSTTTTTPSETTTTSSTITTTPSETTTTHGRRHPPYRKTTTEHPGTSTTPAVCKDIYYDCDTATKFWPCKYLIQFFLKFCEKTCKMCK